MTILPCDSEATPGNPFHTIGRIKGIVSFPLDAQARGVHLSEQQLLSALTQIATAIAAFDAEREAQWAARLGEVSK